MKSISADSIPADGEPPSTRTIVMLPRLLLSLPFVCLCASCVAPDGRRPQPAAAATAADWMGPTAPALPPRQAAPDPPQVPPPDPLHPPSACPPPPPYMHSWLRTASSQRACTCWGSPPTLPRRHSTWRLTSDPTCRTMLCTLWQTRRWTRPWTPSDSAWRARTVPRGAQRGRKVRPAAVPHRAAAVPQRRGCCAPPARAFLAGQLGVPQQHAALGRPSLRTLPSPTTAVLLLLRRCPVPISPNPTSLNPNHLSSEHLSHTCYTSSQNNHPTLAPCSGRRQAGRGGAHSRPVGPQHRGAAGRDTSAQRGIRAARGGGGPAERRGG